MRSPLPGAALSLALLFAVALLLARGCASTIDMDNPFARPDPVVEMRAANAPAPRRAVVVVGDFDNPPTSPLSWPDIGIGFADTLRDELLGAGAFQVQVHQGLAGRIAGVALRAVPPAERDEVLAKARREFPEVEYVIVGRVEEFHHSADVLPAEARRSFLGSIENRAVVAATAAIVDLRTGRVAHQDRFTGAAGAPESPTPRQYAGVEIDSSEFARSPLGKASAVAAKAIADRLDVLAPVRVLQMRVIQAGAGRNVIANGGEANGVARGQRYFVCRQDSASGTLVAIRDDAMQIDLMAEVVAVSENTCELWLMGQPPAIVMLSQCILARERP